MGMEYGRTSLKVKPNATAAPPHYHAAHVTSLMNALASAANSFIEHLICSAQTRT
jgi:hypothetical protein